MKHLLWLIVPAVLLGALALAYAGEGERDEFSPPQTGPASGGAWARFQERFDLDGDGHVTWEEYQKVQSGFARLDADGDGRITAEDAASWPADRHPPRRAGMPPPPPPPPPHFEGAGQPPRPPPGR